MRRIALLGLLACAPLSADASLSVGASVTASSGLGYDLIYPGVTARGDFAHGEFIARAEASYLWAAKRETGDGNAQTASALAGVRFGSFDAMAGAAYVRQETSAWEKDAARALAEFGWSYGDVFRIAVTGSGNGGREDSYSYGLRIEGGKRVRVVGTVDQIHFTSYFGERGAGTRATMAYLWTFGGN